MLLYQNISLIDIVAGLVIIGVGILLADILGKLTKKILESFEIEKILKNRKFPVIDFISSFVKFFVYIIAIVWGIFQMNIELIVLVIFIIFVTIFIIWKILMGIRCFVPNFIARLKLNLNKGKTIEMKHIKGKIIEGGILESKVRSIDGEILYVPNKLLVK